ncbi:MAG: family 16 glycosylhydrolase [Lachnospiraceae bacterium]|nr:family 16 glycosylhydrolase [Lachnospiraceae bacterium]
MACSSSDGEEMTPAEEENTELSCTPASIEALAVGGSYQIAVSAARGEWTAYTTTEWIKVSTAGTATSNGTATIEIGANKEKEMREGSVVVKSGVKNITVAVNQVAPMQVSETTLYSNSSGETFTITVISTLEWTVESGVTWIKVVKEGQNLIVTTAPNDNKTTRTGKVVVKSGEESVVIEVIQDSAEDRDIVAPEGYDLVWHDEFNEGSNLNSGDWTHEVKSAGWVNNELQTYISGSFDGKPVTEFVDGKLHINCFKGSDGKIYSGRVYANVNTGWQYGYIEARIKLPKGKGTWPAFWMMPCNNDFGANPWPKCGEIDIMEEVGCVPNEVSSSLHAEGHNHTNNTQVTHAMTIDKAEGEFHVYAIEWTKDNITTYVDGKVQLTYDNDGGGVRNWPYDKPFYVILNLAWGGSWGGMSGVDENVLPVAMEIDYVRVFQKK